MARPVSSDYRIPTLDLSQFYEKTESYGIDIVIKPDFKSEISTRLILFASDPYEQHTKLFNYFDKEKITLLKEYISR